MSAPQVEDPEFFDAGDLPAPQLPGSPALSLERFEAPRIVPPPPLVKGFAGDAEVAAGLRGILSVETVPVEPLESRLGFTGKGGSEVSQAPGIREDGVVRHTCTIPLSAVVMYSWGIPHRGTPKCHRCISSSAVQQLTVPFSTRQFGLTYDIVEY